MAKTISRNVMGLSDHIKDSNRETSFLHIYGAEAMTRPALRFTHLEVSWNLKSLLNDFSGSFTSAMARPKSRLPLESDDEYPPRW
ncbi:hypothetical protein HAX54_030207 [Datura stramonium]|uniref:Uncharacterized protein n=1 Tax=Datura stramonium TaxID=4076 RepID=A0ABS8V7C9_DATST|nr:hypothetical protein [Datura stramonium]